MKMRGLTFEIFQTIHDNTALVSCDQTQQSDGEQQGQSHLVAEALLLPGVQAPQVGLHIGKVLIVLGGDV